MVDGLGGGMGEHKHVWWISVDYKIVCLVCHKNGKPEDYNAAVSDLQHEICRFWDWKAAWKRAAKKARRGYVDYHL
jgi:hypothetical protein